MKKLTILGFSALSLSAFAQQPSSNIDITANVLAGCTISGQDVAFGEIKNFANDGTTTKHIKNANLSMHCSKNSSFSVKPNLGLHSMSNASFLKHENNEFTDNNINRVQYLINYISSTKNGDVATSGAEVYTVGTGSLNRGSTKLVTSFKDFSELTINLKYELISIGSKLHTGNYSDTVTYSIDFY